jgi:hypothetical protein
MPRRFDDDDELAPPLIDWPPEDDAPLAILPLPLRAPPDAFDASGYVKNFLARPLFAAPAAPLDVPDLRTAARRKFESAGLYEDAGATAAIAPGTSEPDLGALPPSWKLPARGASLPPTILGDDTALGVSQAQASAAIAGPNSELRPPPALPAQPQLPALPQPPSAITAEPVTPLQHPDAQAGLMLSAADSILRQAGEAVARVFGGNPAMLEQAFDTLGALIKTALPPEHHASVDKTTAIARSDAQQQIAARAAAERNRAAVSTLSERRKKAEREHQKAVASGDPAKTAEARREAVQAWRAERLARGDSPNEANAGARDLDRRLRETALRHRLAQLDDAGLDRALEDDDDAQADPAAARRIIDDIRRLRREDPARAGEASIAREIAQRKRNGRIDSPAEEARARFTTLRDRTQYDTRSPGPRWNSPPVRREA